MRADELTLDEIPGIVRIETHPTEVAISKFKEMTQPAYQHEEVYGRFCTVNEYIAAPPREVYEYMANMRSLEEWTYSLRGFHDTDDPGVWVARDRIGNNTDCYIHIICNPDAMTVDYHCAWDQGKNLWMIYLMRVVDAQVVLDKPGSVVLWTNCKHPFYDDNPYPDTAPPQRPVWVGDLWDLFYAVHLVELLNLKAICEYRYANNLPISPPEWAEAAS